MFVCRIDFELLARGSAGRAMSVGQNTGGSGCLTRWTGSTPLMIGAAVLYLYFGAQTRCENRCGVVFSDPWAEPGVSARCSVPANVSDSRMEGEKKTTRNSLLLLGDPTGSHQPDCERRCFAFYLFIVCFQEAVCFLQLTVAVLLLTLFGWFTALVSASLIYFFIYF